MKELAKFKHGSGFTTWNPQLDLFTTVSIIVTISKLFVFHLLLSSKIHEQNFRRSFFQLC